MDDQEGLHNLCLKKKKQEHKKNAGVRGGDNNARCQQQHVRLFELA